MTDGSDVTTEALYIGWTPERLRDEAIRQARIANGAMQLAQDRQIEANVWRGRHAEAEAEAERLRERIEELHIEGGIVKGNLAAAERRVERLRGAIRAMSSEVDPIKRNQIASDITAPPSKP